MSVSTRFFKPWLRSESRCLSFFSSFLIQDPSTGQVVAAPVETPSFFRRVWKLVRGPVLILAAILAGVMSLCVMVTEVTTVISNIVHKQLSVFGLALRLVSDNRGVKTFVMGVPLL